MSWKCHTRRMSIFQALERSDEKGAGDGCKVILTGQMGNATVSNGYIDDVLYDLYRNRRYVTLLRNLNHYCRHVKESRKSALGACLRYFQYADRVAHSSEWTYKPDNPFLNQEIFKDYSVIERLRESGVEYMEKLPLYQETHRSFLGRKAMYTYIGEYETKLGLAAGVVLRIRREMSECCSSAIICPMSCMHMEELQDG